MRPPCENSPALFESTILADHNVARTYCLRCPARAFLACEALAAQQVNHDGTWAGVLYADGKPSTKGRRRYRIGGAV